MSDSDSKPVSLVEIVMGSKSDLETIQPAAQILYDLGIPHEVLVVSAHRTPDWLTEYATTAKARGLHAIIAGAGGAAHLPGMISANTCLPVLGVPVNNTGASPLLGIDALLSIVQMPGGIPVATFAIGKAGAKNAGLFAAALLGLKYPEIGARYEAWRRKNTEDVLANTVIEVTYTPPKA